MSIPPLSELRNRSRLLLDACRHSDESTQRTAGRSQPEQQALPLDACGIPIASSDLRALHRASDRSGSRGAAPGELFSVLVAAQLAGLVRALSRRQDRTRDARQQLAVTSPLALALFKSSGRLAVAAVGTVAVALIPSPRRQPIGGVEKLHGFGGN